MKWQVLDKNKHREKIKNTITKFNMKALKLDKKS